MSEERGPVYGLPLLDSLPLNATKSMRQALPSRLDLERVREISERTAAGYEIVLSNYRGQLAAADWLRRELRDLKAYAEGHHSGEDPCMWIHSLTIDIPDRIDHILGEN